MGIDAAEASAAIERDLRCYANQWLYLQEEEVEVPYGPIHPEASDMEVLSRQGTCIHNVILRPGSDGIQATWRGHSGRLIVTGAVVVISRTHPKVDQLRTFNVATRNQCQLELRPWVPDVDIEKGTWRLDLQVNWVPYYRVSWAMDHFTSLTPPSSPSTLQVLIGSYLGNSRQRRAFNQDTGRAPPADMTALSFLNDSQKNAVQRSLTQRVLLIQGPPGTGKTQVSEAIFRIWKTRELEGPAVGAAPSNVAADNLAKRLMRSKTFDMLRYGPFEKINDEDVRRISSREKARAADWYPTSNSTKAKKRRRQLESEAFAKADVVIGTLEMSSDLATKDRQRSTPLILVDEAAQATEPMTVMVFQLARGDTHVVLVGDHMQLAPTVLSEKAAFKGLEISMFERLWRVPGIDACMLTVQYRMHESICSWPSLEFYGSKLSSHWSVDTRYQVKGFPMAAGLRSRIRSY